MSRRMRHEKKANSPFLGRSDGSDMLPRAAPLHPARKGAVLKYIKAYRRSVLQPRTNTVPRKHSGEQIFFYVSSGKGRVEAEGKTDELEEGTAVFVPAGLEYRFLNPWDEQIEMVLVVERT